MRQAAMLEMTGTLNYCHSEPQEPRRPEGGRVVFDNSGEEQGVLTLLLILPRSAACDELKPSGAHGRSPLHSSVYCDSLEAGARAGLGLERILACL